MSTKQNDSTLKAAKGHFRKDCMETVHGDQRNPLQDISNLPPGFLQQTNQQISKMPPKIHDFSQEQEDSKYFPSEEAKDMSGHLKSSRKRSSGSSLKMEQNDDVIEEGLKRRKTSPSEPSASSREYIDLSSSLSPPHDSPSSKTGSLYSPEELDDLDDIDVSQPENDDDDDATPLILSAESSPTSPASQSPKRPPTPEYHAPALAAESDKWKGGENAWLLPNIDHCMKKREQAYQPAPHYFDWQPYIEPTMRATLIDWLFEVAEECKLHRETVNIAINYIDRFMSKEPTIPRHQYQLVGVAALYIASKLEEYICLSPQRLSHLTDDAYTTKQIHFMEKLIVQKLGWNLLPPTSHSWLKLFMFMYMTKMSSTNNNNNNNDGSWSASEEPCGSQEEDGDTIIDNLKGVDVHQFNSLVENFPKHRFVQMTQLIDYCIMDYSMLKYPPSLLAAAAFYKYYPEDVGIISSMTGSQLENVQEIIDVMDIYESMIPPSNHLPTLPEFLPYDFHEKQWRNPIALEAVLHILKMKGMGSKRC